MVTGYEANGHVVRYFSHYNLFRSLKKLMGSLAAGLFLGIVDDCKRKKFGRSAETAALRGSKPEIIVLNAPIFGLHNS